VENNLNAAQNEISGLVTKISDINNTLTQQIESITSIAGELDNNTEVTEGFNDILTNIQEITAMLDNTDTNSVANTSANTSNPIFDKFMNLPQENKDNVIKQILNTKNSRQAESLKGLLSYLSKHPNDIDTIKNIEAILKPFNSIIKGGKRRGRKTMKKRSNKKYLKGGYVYSASKSLDKESSIVTDSPSRSSSSSSSTRKSNSKKRYFTKKNKSNRQSKSRKSSR
jgi:hypothetical protein